MHQTGRWGLQSWPACLLERDALRADSGRANPVKGAPYARFDKLPVVWQALWSPRRLPGREASLPVLSVTLCISARKDPIER